MCLFNRHVKPPGGAGAAATADTESCFHKTTVLTLFGSVAETAKTRIPPAPRAFYPRAGIVSVEETHLKRGNGRPAAAST